MIKNVFKYKTIILIVLLAYVLRFYKLGELPALNADEAALGYNVYSLIETGLDEHGNAWPIHFESFGDFKPAFYGYLTLPFIYFFGLSVWTVRLPGALLGVVAVHALYELTKQLYPQKKYLPEIAALLLAISPWHIHFSRGGWEVNAATTFIILGILFFIRGIRNHVSNFVYSIVFFAMSLYTYHAARLIVPLLGLSLIFIYRKNIFKFEKESKKVFLGSGLLGLVLLFPLLISIFGPAVGARAGGVSIFSDRGPIDRINVKRGEHESLSSLDAKILHNKPFEYTLNFSENYLEHFWGEFLFLSGDEIQRNKVPEFGLLYLFQFPLLLIAFFAIVRDKKVSAKIFLSWLLIAPIPAAITFQSPHALRAQSMVIPLSFFSAYGLYVLLAFINKQNKKTLVTSYLLLITLLTWSTARYLHQYYIHMAKTYSYSSQYGVEELVQSIEVLGENKERVYITDRYDQPYILFLFYLKYNPSVFQNEHSLTARDKFGFSTVRNFGKFEFTSINWDELRDKRNILIVGTDKEIVDEESNIIKNIYFPSGEVAFQIVEL